MISGREKYIIYYKGPDAKKSTSTGKINLFIRTQEVIFIEGEYLGKKDGIIDGVLVKNFKIDGVEGRLREHTHFRDLSGI